MNLAQFLRARIDEDADHLDCGFSDHDGGDWTPETCPCDFRSKREVEAKRGILALLSSTDAAEIHADAWTVAKWAAQLMALPYADHPDYDERWRP